MNTRGLLPNKEDHCLARYFANRKIAFVYHTPFWTEKGKVVTSHAAVGRYVDSLAPYFSEIILVVPAPGQSDTLQYSLDSTNFKLLHLPHYHNIQGFWFHILVYFWKFFWAAASWDILHVRMPTHLGVLAFLAAKFWKKPTFLVIVGEFYPYNSLSNYPYFKQKIVNADSIVQDALMALMIKKSLVFTNGEELFEKFHLHNDHIHLMRSSTINLGDIVTQKDPSALHDPVRILTVAVVSPSKGTILIPDILLNLRKMGHHVEWHYVGKTDGTSGEQELQRTLARIVELDISENLIFYGQKSWNELKEHYHNSDLFVLPTYVEGIPRVLLEAQASGLPIVTTTVGGIPKAIQNGYNGILVPPGDPVLIAKAIGEIIRDKKLYRYLMSNGFETAKQLSLESETNRMLQKVYDEFNISLDMIE